ncbi:hypothetical protein LBMAG42_51640 [Deltaproteobacteria bacterium]|nr:hypothetical protein LBMAG42_51640 [Deltaproteobacteria bacterium]
MCAATLEQARDVVERARELQQAGGSLRVREARALIPAAGRLNQGHAVRALLGAG